MNIFSFIKSHVSIVDVIGEYTSLKRAGTYFKSRCPFHHEKTASFTVSPHKEIFYCFGCHAGGDVITFISKIENCTQLEAARFLIDRYSIEVPQDIEISEINNQEKKHYFDICDLVTEWYKVQLKKNPSVLKYIEQRGIDSDSIDYFSVGFFPGGLASINNLIHTLKKEHILLDDLIDTGIILQGKTVLYSPFEDRIIFPIRDHLGRCCGFGGRIFKPQDTRAKYYNSRENSYFNKGAILFGLDLAKKSIQKYDRVYLVEGYTDCIAMVQHGYPNTVATLGTACTIAHLKQLNRYANHLYLLYDSDKAGEQAILRLAQLCWQADMEPMVVSLPTGQDPASFLQAGNDLTSRIEQAKDIFIFYIETLGKGFATKPLYEKVQLTRNFIEIIQEIKDSLKQDFLLQKASKTFEIPFESLKHELAKVSVSSIKEEPAETPIESTFSSLEKQIFCAILHDVRLLKTLQDKYIIASLPEPLDSLVERLWQYRNENSFDFTIFFDSLEQNEREYVSRFLLEQDKPISPQVFEQLVQQLYKKHWKTIVQKIKEHLAIAKQEGNNEKAEQIIAHFQSLKQKILPTISH